MSTILAAAQDLPPTPTLHLLPFSLTPTPPTAPISTYFRPRTAPPNHPSAGRQIAAFRGRQIVAQEISVPRGYVGVVLRAEGVPGLSRSTSSYSEPSSARDETSSTSVGVSTRTRGAGQVALSRPRPRTRRAAAKRKFKLDDEEEDEKPVKRVTTPEPVPAIRVVAATPGAGDNEVSVAVEQAVEDAVDEEETQEAKVERTESMMTVVETVEGWKDDGSCSELAAVSMVLPVEVNKDDFSSTASLSAVSDAAGVNDEQHADPARVLKPVSGFSSFTLWTPDAPLAGFDQDEEIPEGGWRRGGAGDGGDEFVRALGEWLGIGQVIHTPLYGDDEDEE